jgi:surface antigen
MFHHQPVSAYLGKPNTLPRRQHPWNGFRTQFVEIRRDNPRVLSRLLIGLLLWCLIVGTIQNIASLTSSAPNAHNTSLSLATSNQHGKPPTTQNATLASVEPVSTLTSGPTGQPLPPGSLAADYTFANNYAKGQCTWYVAGRRQIPPNWGNAISWYYHATDSGWAVGEVPAVGAIAWTPNGYFGHVAIVEQVADEGNMVYISEMNSPRMWVKDYRWVQASQFKYIY